MNGWLENQLEKASNDCLRMAMTLPLGEAEHFKPGLDALNVEAKKLATGGFPLALNFVHGLETTWGSIVIVVSGLSSEQLSLYCEGFTRFSATLTKEFDNVYLFLGEF